MAAKKIIKAVKTILRDDYKPKLKNEKEVYSRVKQDYSDVIKNYEKTQKRKQRNRSWKTQPILLLFVLAIIMQTRK